MPSYWAHCEALLLKDPAAARKVWEDTLVRGSLGRYYEGWAAWAAMERGMRLIKEARAVYKKAYSRKLEEGGQLAICSDWLRFEREEGRCASAKDCGSAEACFVGLCSCRVPLCLYGATSCMIPAISCGLPPTSCKKFLIKFF